MIDELADYPPDELEHPEIKTARQTCSACPDQWEGELHDGRHFYFRYRSGRASLALGPDRVSVAGVTGPYQHEAVDAVVISHGDGLRGMFDSDHERAEVFARLFGEVTRVREPGPACDRCGSPHLCPKEVGYALGVPEGRYGRCTECGDVHACDAASA